MFSSYSENYKSNVLETYSLNWINKLKKASWHRLKGSASGKNQCNRKKEKDTKERYMCGKREHGNRATSFLHMIIVGIKTSLFMTLFFLYLTAKSSWEWRSLRTRCDRPHLQDEQRRGDWSGADGEPPRLFWIPVVSPEFRQRAGDGRVFRPTYTPQDGCNGRKHRGPQVNNVFAF